MPKPTGTRVVGLFPVTNEAAIVVCQLPDQAEEDTSSMAFLATPDGWNPTSPVPWLTVGASGTAGRIVNVGEGGDLQCLDAGGITEERLPDVMCTGVQGTPARLGLRVQRVRRFGRRTVVCGMPRQILTSDDCRSWSWTDDGLLPSLDDVVTAVSDYCEGGEEAIAVGPGGSLFHRQNGSRWRPIVLDTRTWLKEAAYFDGEFWVAGKGGYLARGDGTAFHQVSSDPKAWGLAAVAGDLYRIVDGRLHVLGKSGELSPARVELPASIRQISSSEGAIWILGADDSVWLWNCAGAPRPV